MLTTLLFSLAIANEADCVNDCSDELDGTWWVSCPDGMKPGPADACVIDTSEWPQDDDDCPPGFVPGPSGECVPDRATTLGRELLALTASGLASQGALTETRMEMRADWGAQPTDDVQTSIETILECWE